MRRNLEMIRLDIISKCNFNCCFCSRPVIENKNGIMDLSDVISILDLFTFLKIPHIDFTPISGEFFCHPNYKEILLEFSKRKMHTFEFISNGFLCSDNDLEFVKSLPNVSIMFSVYGKDYDEFKQITNRFDIEESSYLEFCNKLSKFNSHPRFTFALRTLTNETPNNIHGIMLNKSLYKNQYSKRSGGNHYGSSCSFFAKPLCITWDKKVSICGCTRPNFGEEEFIIGHLEKDKNGKHIMRKNSNFIPCFMTYLKNGIKSFRWCEGCILASEDPKSLFDKEDFYTLMKLFL